MTYDSSGKATFHDVNYNYTIEMKPGEIISFD
jgi:Ca2+-binding EF-hand superfamily protein